MFHSPARRIGGESDISLGYLEGVFPRSILPSDVDAEVEIGGKFLTLELKNWGERLSGGQQRMLAAKSLVPQFRVFVVWHDRRPALSSDVLLVTFDHEDPLARDTRTDMKLRQWVEVVRRWSCLADTGEPIPSARDLALWASTL